MPAGSTYHKISLALIEHNTPNFKNKSIKWELTLPNWTENGISTHVETRCVVILRETPTQQASKRKINRVSCPQIIAPPACIHTCCNGCEWFSCAWIKSSPFQKLCRKKFDAEKGQIKSKTENIGVKYKEKFRKVTYSHQAQAHYLQGSFWNTDETVFKNFWIKGMHTHAQNTYEITSQ